jgi:hypothetical protein
MQQLRNPYYLGDEQTLTETSGWADAGIFGKLLLGAERREEATAQFATALPPSQPRPLSPCLERGKNAVSQAMRIVGKPDGPSPSRS